MKIIKTTYERFGALALCIGRQGENEVTEVRIDISTPLADFPGAWFGVQVERPDGICYPAVCETDGDTLIWKIQSADTARSGKGKAQVVMYGEDGEIGRSKPVDTAIMMSIISTDQTPDPVQNWMDDAQKLLEELRAYELPVEQIEQIVRDYLEENPPEGGGVSKDELAEAIKAYFDENPVVTQVSINGESPDENGNFVLNVLNDAEIADLSAVLT